MKSFRNFDYIEFEGRLISWCVRCLKREILRKDKLPRNVIWAGAIYFVFNGLSHCLPMRCYTDEAYWIEPIQAFWRLNFRSVYAEDVNWAHPGHTIINLTWIFSYVPFVYLFLLKRVNGYGDFISYQLGMGKNLVFLTGRVVNAAFAFLILLMVFRVCRLMAERGRARVLVPYFAMLNLLLCGLFLYYAKHVRSDIPQAFFDFAGLYVLFLLIRDYPKGRLRYVFVFGLCAGLSVFTKWTGAVGAGSLAVVGLWILVRRWGEWVKIITEGWKMVAVVILGFLVGSFIGSPTWLFHINEIKGALLIENKVSLLGADRRDFWERVIFYQQILASSYGLLVFFLFWMGWVRLGFVSWRGRERKKRFEEMLFYFFPVMYLFSISGLRIYHARWLIPLLAPFSVVAALGFDFLISVFRVKRKVFVYGLIVLVLSYSFTRSFLFNLAFGNGDTRVVGMEYWETSIRPHSQKVLYDGYTPFLPDGETVLPVQPLSFYEEMGYEKIMLSSHIYNIYLSDRGVYREKDRFYRDIMDNKKREVFFPGNPVQWDFIVNRTYDWDFWRGLATRGKDYLTLPLGPDIAIYSMD